MKRFKLSHKCPICENYIYFDQDILCKKSKAIHLSCYIDKVLEQIKDLVKSYSFNGIYKESLIRNLNKIKKEYS